MQKFRYRPHGNPGTNRRTPRERSGRDL